MVWVRGKAGGRVKEGDNVMLGLVAMTNFGEYRKKTKNETEERTAKR